MIIKPMLLFIIYKYFKYKVNAVRYTFQRKFFLIFVLVLSVLLSGCSSIDNHFIEGEFGHPYAGLVEDALGTPCVLASSRLVLFIPVPFWVADMALTTVVDTVLLPIDLAMMFSTDMEYSDLLTHPAIMCQGTVYL